MVQVSEGSGGQVFLLDPSEVASSATLLLARDGHDETLRRIVGDLDAGVRTVDVAVHARSSLTAAARLVREGGRPGHLGLFRDDAPLVPGTRRLMEITVSSGIVGPTFEMRGSTDERIGHLPPVRQADGDWEQTYLSEFVVPGVPFRVVVSGSDRAGKSVQRAQGSLFQLSQTR
jgi:hypothetical protein